MEATDIQQLLAMLTPEQLKILLVGIGYCCLARPFYRGLIWLVQAYVKRTATKTDDEALARVLAWTDPMVSWLDVLRRCSLGLTLGPFPSTQPLARSIAPQSMRPLTVPPPSVLGIDPAVSVVKPVTFTTAEPPPSPKEPNP